MAVTLLRVAGGLAFGPASPMMATNGHRTHARMRSVRAARPAIDTIRPI